MRRVGQLIARSVAAACLAYTGAHGVAAAQSEAVSALEVHGGSASFEVGTNIPAISIHGKSTQLSASARVIQMPDGIRVTGMQAVVPIRSLTTGLGLRDDHMRRYIFTTDAGQVPDLRFTSEGADCGVMPGQRGACRIEGQLAIRGASRRFSIELKVNRDGAGVRAVGESLVRLSDYGIAAPSQLGVRTADEVHLRLEFTARGENPPAMSAGGRP